MMKRISIYLLLAAATLQFSACLKDDSYTFDPKKDNSTLELFGGVRNSVSDSFAIINSAIDLADEADFAVTVNYAGNNNAPADITLTLGIDPEAVTIYNNQEGTDYISMPDSLYSVPSATVTIPKGQRRATWIVKLKPRKFDFTKNFALPVKIMSATAGTISGNFGTMVYAVSIKNQYDGVYTVTGTYKDVNLPDANAKYPKSVALVTKSATTVAAYDMSSGDYFFHFDNGGGTYYGNWDPIFAFDANNNVTSVVNYYGQATNSQQRAGRLNTATGTVNKFTIGTDGTKTLEVSYIMVQAGADRVTFTEKYVYTGPR